MRALYKTTKRANEVDVRTFDFNPWLQSIGSMFVSGSVSDAPDLIESSSFDNGVCTLRLTGGVEGKTYRLAITCTATNGMTRSTALDVAIPGVLAADQTSQTFQPLLDFLSDGLSVGGPITSINFIGATVERVGSQLTVTFASASNDAYADAYADGYADNYTTIDSSSSSSSIYADYYADSYA